MSTYRPLRLSVPLSLEEPDKDRWLLDENIVKSALLRKLLKYLKWLDSKIPFLMLYPRRKPVIVREIEEQLRMRSDFPLAEWQETAYRRQDVESVLKFISDELIWPNHHFIPADPLMYALFTAAGDNLLYISDDINRRFGTTFSVHTLHEMAMGHLTVGNLVKHVLESSDATDT